MDLLNCSSLINLDIPGMWLIPNNRRTVTVFCGTVVIQTDPKYDKAVGK